MSRLGMDDIVACLFAGVGLAWDGWTYKQLNGSHIVQIFDCMLNIIFFSLLGTLIPFSAFRTIGFGKLFALSFWILFIRRIPVVYMLKSQINSIESGFDIFSVAFFAPVGCGAILYATKSVMLGIDFQDTLFAIIFFCILVPSIIYTLAIPIFKYVLKRNRKKENSILVVRVRVITGARRVHAPKQAV
jgi:NhaP-type Na+/H+ or K+/H+ antiporter